ncbi:zwei Ig domain protein zig-8-like [Gigantopelta aegis]|uniref:zwei Ig domain protein zig-8-like n=1 Tax=Gigantopelta aegis TaxID=1735272 RepID=UPI001B88CB2F|nr:zwei Ig domain protein zig-8-like [Gigantopelta aegis]
MRCLTMTESVRCLNGAMLFGLFQLFLLLPHTGGDRFDAKGHRLIELLNVPNNITVREGDLAILPCAVLHLGTKQVVWRRMDKDHITAIGTMTWVKDPNVSVEHRDLSPELSHWNLMIKMAKPRHSGLYECRVTTTKVLSRTVQLNVVGPPLTKPEIAMKGKEFVEMGEQIRLSCKASGGPQIPEEMDWFKDGDKIDMKKYKNVLITKYRSLAERALVSELLIDRSRIHDSGTYICRSSSDEIDSIKVTVLVADSSNVKRGTVTSMPGRASSCVPARWLLQILTVLTFVKLYFTVGFIS